MTFVIMHKRNDNRFWEEVARVETFIEAQTAAKRFAQSDQCDEDDRLKIVNTERKEATIVVWDVWMLRS